MGMRSGLNSLQALLYGFLLGANVMIVAFGKESAITFAALVLITASAIFHLWTVWR
jgi:hypothetical protein